MRGQNQGGQFREAGKAAFIITWLPWVVGLDDGGGDEDSKEGIRTNKPVLLYETFAVSLPSLKQSEGPIANFI